MRLWVTLTVILVTATLFALAHASRIDRSAPIHTVSTVVLTDAGFEPRTLHIVEGSTVIFTTTRSFPFWPASDPHPSHSIHPDFDSQGPVSPKDQWSYTFETPGTWQFHDHLRSYFTGTVYVSAP